jgi:hypothetical protein
MPTDIANQIRLAVSRDLAPAAVSARLAAFAKADVAARIRAEQFPATYRRFVDGREGAAEETVRADGVIAYRGNILPSVIAYGLGVAQGRSPVESGEYRHSWLILVDGAIWKSTTYTNVPQGATVTITNFAPYSRRLEIGKTKSGRAFVMQVPPRIVEAVAQMLKRKFADMVTVDYAYIEIPGGYRLRSHFHSRRTGRLRSDRSRGAQMTYPSAIIRQR